MILNALALKLKRQARGDFKGRYFEATLIRPGAPRVPALLSPYAVPAGFRASRGTGLLGAEMVPSY